MDTSLFQRIRTAVRPRQQIGFDRVRRLTRQFAFVAGIAFVGKVGFAPPPPVRVWEVRVEADAYCERGRVRPPLDLSLVSRIPVRPSGESGLAVAAVDEPGMESFEEIQVDIAQTGWAPVWARGRELWLVKRSALRAKNPRGSLEDVGILLGSVNWRRVRCSEDGQPVHVSLPLWMNPEGSTYARRNWTHRCGWDRTSTAGAGNWVRVSRDSLTFSTQRGPLHLESASVHPTDDGFFSCML